MTDDLKTKIAEAIKRAVADALYDGYDNAFANKSEWTAEHGYRKGAFHDINEPMKGDYDGAGDQATKAALQAIHDAGFAVVPRSALMAAIKLSQDGRRTASLPAIGHILTDALIVASQPKTEGGET